MRRLLLAFVASCVPLAFAVDPAFPPEEQTELREAAETWNPVTVPEKKITLAGGKWRLARQMPRRPEWSGYCSRSEQLVQIHPLALHKRSVAAHEFGHALGMRHHCWMPGGLPKPRPGEPQCEPLGPSLGIMDPGHSSAELTAADLAECRRVGSCPKE